MRTVLLLALLVLSSIVYGDDEYPALPSVFAIPELTRQGVPLNRELMLAFKANDYAKAERASIAFTKAFPWEVSGWYNVACAYAMQGKTDYAFGALTRAVHLGYRDLKHMSVDTDLKPLHDDPRWAVLVRRMETEPVPPQMLRQTAVRRAEGGVALIGESNTLFQNGVFLCGVEVDEKALAESTVLNGFGELDALVNTWYAEGTAAGNIGDYYHNHDLDHVNMHYARFLQLTRLEYSEEAKGKSGITGQRLDTGAQVGMFFTGTVLGNSSTAMVTSPYWRSQPRLILTNPAYVSLLHTQYTSNHIYLYPEHKDHDYGRNGEGGDEKGHGDVFPANTPYMVISQGSSGSEMQHMDSLMLVLAALRPEVKQRLRESRTLMPTLQMILRRCYGNENDDDSYLSGRSHPTVFDGRFIDARKMVMLAHSLTLETLPPIVQIQVLQEDLGTVGTDYFHTQAHEKLFDTPAAIARIHRSSAWERRMVVTAEGSGDLNSLPLTYKWVVLRGDPSRITIKPLNAAGSRAEIRVGWHPAYQLAGEASIGTSRVDIGVFVHNGHHWSAPAFVSTFFLDNEDRVYGPGHRVESITYHGGTDEGDYVDPLLDTPKSWTDLYRYDAAGRCTGWIRRRDGQADEIFAADGRLLQAETGAPTAVRYEAVPKPNKTMRLQQVPAD